MDNIKDGYTRVSEIISLFSDFSHIEPHVLANKARIGTNVHKAINEHIELGINLSPLNDRESLYFQSWKGWYENQDGRVNHMETRLYDDARMITGCIDGIWVNTGACLIDWKTSANENPLTWPLQAALYIELIRLNKEQFDFPIFDTAFFLKLDRYGKKAQMCSYPLTSFHFDVANALVKLHSKRGAEACRLVG